MDGIIQVTALCLMGAVLCALLKKDSPELGLLLAIAVCAAVLSLLCRSFRELRSFLEQLVTWGGVSSDIFTPLIKTLGIALISRTGGNLCRDAGQSAMASLVEMAGAFGAILVTMPLYYAVWEMLQSML